MRGGFFISEGEDVFRRCVDVIIQLGGKVLADAVGDGIAQVQGDSGHLFTASEIKSPELAWEYREEPFRPADGVDLPDMKTVYACAFECRWPDLVSVVAARFAEESDVPIWVLDGNGTIWKAESIDPQQIFL